MMQLLLPFPVRFRLRNKLIAVLAVIIGPPVYGGYLAGPIAMTRMDRRRPFQRVRPPRVLILHFSSVKNAVNEVDDKKNLGEENQHGGNRDKPVQISEHVE